MFAGRKRFGLLFSREARNNLVWIAVGTFFAAASSNLFYAPVNMVPGGFTGLAIVMRAEFLCGWAI